MVKYIFKIRILKRKFSIPDSVFYATILYLHYTGAKCSNRNKTLTKKNEQNFNLTFLLECKEA